MNVVINGKEQPYKYFEEEHEVALGLSADGMCPFKHERTKIDNVICVGVVPGPKCPVDLNSFLQPLIDELPELARGIPAVDVFQRKLFALRAHLIDIFGDIPAITKFLEFIGHNGRFPCHIARYNTQMDFGSIHSTSSFVLTRHAYRLDLKSSKYQKTPHATH
ncbi:Transposase family Tnp2 protein [Ceratobasidium theobromae]|uniref:Transposase family Tnp2 protein n=1 Tax=Ceratobasidium theobromae TaxID=1582974 RepID=A0A5N5Q7N9_9AGAM|nr:Transposase family Tnp2 protein [Ceratobasidium theobromae]